jgi:hypothetical protein
MGVISHLQNDNVPIASLLQREQLFMRVKVVKDKRDTWVAALLWCL